MLYFIRHGQTNHNVNEVFSGVNKISINKTGRKQAKEIAEKLKNVAFDVIFCSPLKRAKQTLKYVKKFHKQTPIIFDNRLIERVHGDLENVKVNSIEYNIWKQSDEKEVVGLESLADLCDRVKKFYDEILQTYYGQNILVVAHFGIYKATFAYFNNIPKNSDFSIIEFENNEIGQFETN